MNKSNTELKQLNKEQLITKIEQLRRDKLTLRLNSVTAHVKDYSQFKKIRKNLARALTYARQTK